MTARWLKEESMNEKIPPQYENIPHDGKGVQGAQFPHQGDHIPNVKDVMSCR